MKFHKFETFEHFVHNFDCRLLHACRRVEKGKAGVKFLVCSKSIHINLPWVQNYLCLMSVCLLIHVCCPTVVLFSLLPIYCCLWMRMCYVHRIEYSRELGLKARRILCFYSSSLWVCFDKRGVVVAIVVVSPLRVCLFSSFFSSSQDYNTEFIYEPNNRWQSGNECFQKIKATLDRTKVINARATHSFMYMNPLTDNLQVNYKIKQCFRKSVIKARATHS